MIIHSESEMLKLGQKFAQKLTLPTVFELVGDVGTGKTTFTRGLAAGLGISESVTSPSFTISKRYAFDRGELVHYDFYRLNDPGIMRDELAETLANPQSVVVIEWGGDVAELLPAQKLQLELSLNEDGSRSITMNQNAQKILE